MGYKNKIVLMIIFALILVAGFSYWYFLLKKTPSIEQMTLDKRIGILSTIENISVKTIPDLEKQKVLNKTDSVSTTSTLSNEERLQILDKTN